MSCPSHQGDKQNSDKNSLHILVAILVQSSTQSIMSMWIKYEKDLSNTHEMSTWKIKHLGAASILISCLITEATELME